jgi:hypothetical protein
MTIIQHALFKYQSVFSIIKIYCLRFEYVYDFPHQENYLVFPISRSNSSSRFWIDTFTESPLERTNQGGLPL